MMQHNPYVTRDRIFVAFSRDIPAIRAALARAGLSGYAQFRLASGEIHAKNGAVFVLVGYAAQDARGRLRMPPAGSCPPGMHSLLPFAIVGRGSPAQLPVWRMCRPAVPVRGFAF